MNAPVLTARQTVKDEALRFLEARLSMLRPYLEDPTVTEIMCNGGGVIFVERAGQMQRVPETITDTALESSVRAIMTANNKDATPIMDARLTGLRVAAAISPVAVHGPMLVIRRHATRKFPLSYYAETGAFDAKPADTTDEDRARENAQIQAEAAAGRGGTGLIDFIRWAVAAHKNILIVGGTSSGKTTLLSSCLMEIPPQERIITLEDTHEITLDQPNIVQLEASPQHGITIRDLIRLCLRSRPDRIIVGEIRGAEAYDFLDALNTGHGGSFCTLHADSAALGLQRLESLVRMSPTSANLPLADLRSMIASAVDYVIFQARIGGVRAPRQVIRLDGVTEQGQYRIQTIFER